MKEADTEVSLPKFQLGEQSRLAQRIQRYRNHKDQIHTKISELRRETPEITHVTFSSNLSDNITYRTSLRGVEKIFYRAAMSFTLAGLDQGLDLGHDAFLHRCVEESKPTPDEGN